VTYKFKSVASGSKSSTAVVREILAALLRTPVPTDAAEFRKTYRSLFRQLTIEEFRDSSGGTHIMRTGLDLFHKSIVSDAGNTLDSDISRAWTETEHKFSLIEWRGVEGSKAFPDLTHKSVDWVTNHLAEPHAAVALSSVAGTQLASEDVLIALAAGAECAPTIPWLQAGGSVVAIMRSGEGRWLRLLNETRRGSSLFVPIRWDDSDGPLPTDAATIAKYAGIDLLEDCLDIARLVGSFVASADKHKLLVGGFAYAPGAQHILVQAVQDSLMAQAGKAGAALAWLGTPTDSVAVPATVIEENLQRYAGRSFSARMRDAVWQVFGQLKRPPSDILETSAGLSFGVIDCSAEMQGPNYAISKRSQRWRACVAAADGIRTAYITTPPARTDSVLSFRILHATYQGAPKVGITPFTVEDTVQLGAQLMVARMRQGTAVTPGFDVFHSDAVHAGLWRLKYLPQSVWRAATVLGFWGYIVRNQR